MGPQRPNRGEMPQNPNVYVQPQVSAENFGAVNYEVNQPNVESVGETAPASPAEVAPAAPVVIPMPQNVRAAPAPQPVQVNVGTNNAPSTAADEDLIEKEWVDKAKAILAETKDDPHGRERKIGDLQRDYLFKRYGRVIGRAE